METHLEKLNEAANGTAPSVVGVVEASGIE